TIYYLQNNVSAEETCFTIAEDNITLDGQGFLIGYGNNSVGSRYGVYSDNKDNLIIRNANITQLNSAGSQKSAIYFDDGVNITVINSSILTIGSTTARGIYFHDVWDAYVIDI